MINTVHLAVHYEALFGGLNVTDECKQSPAERVGLPYIRHPVIVALLMTFVNRLTVRKFGLFSICVVVMCYAVILNVTSLVLQ